MNAQDRHVVAVVGGAVAGAQMARKLAEAGAKVYVFEQNFRPFGKIEDGLPKWHVGLRKKEYERIKTALSTEGVCFVPNTKIGRDIDFYELVERWGFSAVVLAIGAWRDRPLPVKDAAAFEDKGLIYQNPFIISYNHSDDASFTGRRYPIEDGAVVVGGGLASLDVVKLHMLEITRRKLAERGHDIGIEEIEKKGVFAACEGFGVDYASLEIKGATLLYRKGAGDLSVKAPPENPTDEDWEKLRTMRERILQRALDKYGFHFEPYSEAKALIIEDDRAVGLTVERKRPGEDPACVELRAPYIVSSIGSLPVPIEGVPMNGELMPFVMGKIARLRDFPKVFGAGNVVTGKGNIMVSRKHSAAVGEELVEAFLGLGDTPRKREAELLDLAENRMEHEAERVSKAVCELPMATPEAQAHVAELAKARQAAVGYSGDLEAWLSERPPV